MSPPASPSPTPLRLFGTRRGKIIGAVLAGSAAALLGVAVVIGLGGRGDQVSAEPSSTASPSNMPVASAKPSNSTPPPSAPVPPSIAPAPPSEWFARVVADRVDVRVAPTLQAELVTMDVADGGPMPVAVGHATPWEDVYVFDGPVEADGFRWYLMGTDRSIDPNRWSAYPEVIGWIAAADTSGPWLLPISRCPAPPFELADVTYLASTWGMRLGCFGGQALTLQGWFPDLPADIETSGDCAREPAWLICGYGYYDVRVTESTFRGSSNRLEFKVDPAIGITMPERDRWIEIVGRFDDPAAQICAKDDVETILQIPAQSRARGLWCRLEFVVVGARALGN